MLIHFGLSIVKTLNEYISDNKPLKLEEQRGFDTLVVLALNDAV